MSPQLERVAVLLALVLLANATLALFLPHVSGRTRERIGIGLLATVAIVLGGAIAGRWLREAQGPFLTMYDVLLSNVFGLAFVFVITTRVSEAARPAVRVVTPLLLGMGIWLAMVPPEAVPLPATFDNSWLWIHVLSGKVFLGLCMVSAAAVVLRFATAGEPRAGHDRQIWSWYFIAFIFHTIMLISGSAWAHTAWGRFWSWDGLEISTLVTWLLIGGTLHARVTFKSMPERTAQALIVASFALAFLTFFGLPFLSIGPHKGFV